MHLSPVTAPPKVVSAYGTSSKRSGHACYMPTKSKQTLVCFPTSATKSDQKNQLVKRGSTTKRKSQSQSLCMKTFIKAATSRFCKPLHGYVFEGTSVVTGDSKRNQRCPSSQSIENVCDC